MAKWIAFAIALTCTQSSVATENVSLQFNWPDAVTLHVTRSHERVARLGHEAIRSSSLSEYDWKGSRDGENYRIAFSEFRPIDTEQRPRVSDAVIQLDYAARLIEAIRPTIVVDGNGQPVSIEGMESATKSISEILSTVPNLENDLTAKRLSKVLTNEETIRLRSFDDWNKMIQIWSGNVVELGQKASGEASIANPLGTQITKHLTFRIGDRILSAPDASRQNCIELSYFEVPSSTEVRPLSKAYLGFDFVTQLGAPESAKLEIRDEYSTIVRIDSLIPVGHFKKKYWSVSWPNGKGGNHTVDCTDTWKYRFDMR